MIEWKPKVGDRWYGSAIVVEENRYLIRSATKQTINDTEVMTDEIFVAPKLVAMNLTKLINVSVVVMVIGERRLEDGRKFWDCNVSMYEEGNRTLN